MSLFFFRSPEEYYIEFIIEEEITEKNAVEGVISVVDDILDYNQKALDWSIRRGRQKDLDFSSSTKSCFDLPRITITNSTVIITFFQKKL